MRILPRIGFPATKNTQTSIKVCMHVLGSARTDVRVMREATALVEAGFAVSIVDVESDRTLPVEEHMHGIRVQHINRPSWFVSTRFKPWFLVKLALMTISGALRLIRTPADVYHAHEETALLACYLAARVRRKPLIFDAHELPWSEPYLRRWRRLHAVSVRLLAGLVPRCAGVITVSPSIVQEIGNSYSCPDVTLIRNIPAYQAVSRSDRLRQHLGLGPGVRLALYQGGFQSYRGLDRLIRAAAFVEHDIVIVIMGKGSEQRLFELETLIASEGVADRVKILPPVPYAELLDWTASADIGLIIHLPDHSLNIKMCLPNKLFEYLMAGLPVLSSQLDAIVEVIKTYDVGQIVSSVAPAEIGAAVNTMLADRAALARMRRNALEAAQRDLHWGKESRQLIRLYHSILMKSGEGSGERETSFESS
jgi:glycosyltransferase involved in cell wall biosynthesis